MCCYGQNQLVVYSQKKKRFKRFDLKYNYIQLRGKYRGRSDNNVVQVRVTNMH